MDISVLAFKSIAPFSALDMDNDDNNTEDGEMHITLQKREKGKTWSSPIQGQGILDPYAADQEQKRLMLQRFQEEVYSTFCTSFLLFLLCIFFCNSFLAVLIFFVYI